MSATAEPRLIPHSASAWWKYLVWIGLGVLVLTFLVYRSTRREVARVQVTYPTYQDISSSISTGGTAVPVDDFQAHANFSGIIEKLDVHLGEKIPAGTVLVEMKDPYDVSRVETARAALDSAEVNNQNVLSNGSQEDRIGFAADRVRAQLEQASASDALATLKKLELRGSATEAEVTAGTQRLQAADAALRAMNERDTARYSPKDIESWQAKVAAAKASLQAERITYANAHIASPVAGTVYLLPVSQYDFVPMGADLLHVADLNHIKVLADFDEPEVGKLHAGQKVEVRWDGDLSRTWHGHVVVSPLAVMGAGARSIGRSTIAIDDAKGDLPANANVTATVTLDTRTHVLTIPRNVLHTEGSDHFIYRVVSGKLVRTPVDIGLVNVNSAEVTRGLSSSDAIVEHVLSDETLTSGLRVEVVH
jgi:HlyD family secretion protein